MFYFGEQVYLAFDSKQLLINGGSNDVLHLEGLTSRQVCLSQ